MLQRSPAERTEVASDEDRSPSPREASTRTSKPLEGKDLAYKRAEMQLASVPSASALVRQTSSSSNMSLASVPEVPIHIPPAASNPPTEGSAKRPNPPNGGGANRPNPPIGGVANRPRPHPKPSPGVSGHPHSSPGASGSYPLRAAHWDYRPTVQQGEALWSGLEKINKDDLPRKRRLERAVTLSEIIKTKENELAIKMKHLQALRTSFETKLMPKVKLGAVGIGKDFEARQEARKEGIAARRDEVNEEREVETNLGMSPPASVEHTTGIPKTPVNGSKR